MELLYALSYFFIGAFMYFLRGTVIWINNVEHREARHNLDRLLEVNPLTIMKESNESFKRRQELHEQYERILARPIQRGVWADLCFCCMIVFFLMGTGTFIYFWLDRLALL